MVEVEFVVSRAGSTERLGRTADTAMRIDSGHRANCPNVHHSNNYPRAYSILVHPILLYILFGHPRMTFQHLPPAAAVMVAPLTPFSILSLPLPHRFLSWRN